MPLPKKFVHQLPVMLEPRQYEHVLKLADGGSQAQIVRDAIDLQIDVATGAIQTVPAEELARLQLEAGQVGRLVTEIAELTDLLQEANRRQDVPA
jgi:hypothetical protein